MSFKRDVILWVSATLTAFVIVVIFLTIFRTELNASRRLFIRSSATLKKTEALLQEAVEISTQVKKIVERSEFIRQHTDKAYARVSSQSDSNHKAVMEQFGIMRDDYDRLRTQVGDNYTAVLTGYEIVRGGDDTLLKQFDDNYTAVLKGVKSIQGRFDQINEKRDREQIAHDKLRTQVGDNYTAVLTGYEIVRGGHKTLLQQFDDNYTAVLKRLENIEGRLDQVK